MYKSALLLMTALLLSGCGRHRPDARGVEHDETLLQVSATGHAETRPDEARFSAGVDSRGATSAIASQENNKAMAKVVAAITALGVEDKYIKTETLTVERIEYGKARGTYTASNIVEVRVRKIDDAGKIIGAATAAGANVVSGPDLRVSDQEAANKSAYAAAYKAALARAEAYAGAANLKIERVLAIRDGGARSAPTLYQTEAMDVAPRTVAPPPFNPGLQDSDVSVSVDFALEPN